MKCGSEVYVEKLVVLVIDKAPVVCTCTCTKDNKQAWVIRLGTPVSQGGTFGRW